MKMQIKKGTLLNIKHSRKGQFIGMAREEFNSETAEFYPIDAAVPVEGVVNNWQPGESIPCRASFCEISVYSNEN